jgi:hypothetical protein
MSLHFFDDFTSLLQKIIDRRFSDSAQIKYRYMMPHRKLSYQLRCRTPSSMRRIQSRRKRQKKE